MAFNNSNYVQSYTSKALLYKYGEIKIDSEGYKLFVLISSVVPFIPKVKMANIDEFLMIVFSKKFFARLVFEIDGVEESLTFHLFSPTINIKAFMLKILLGELTLKGKYFSEIFVYKESYSFKVLKLVTFGENDENRDKLFILPKTYNVGGSTIGFYCYDKNFLKQLVSSEYHKVKNVYIFVEN